MEYDGTKPLTLRPRFSEPSQAPPPFETPPGACASEFRAMRALAMWMVTPGIYIAPFVFPIVGLLSVPAIAILLALLGELLVLQLMQHRAGRVFALLPVRPKAISRLLWFVSVVYSPLLYGLTQTFIRVPYGLANGDLTWAGRIAPECILAMGVASMFHLCRPVTSRWLFSVAHSSQDLNLLMMLVLWILMWSGWFLGNDVADSSYLAGSTIIAAVFIGTSYRFSTRETIQPLDARMDEEQGSWFRRGARKGASSFLGLWLSALTFWSGYTLIVVAVWLIVRVARTATADADVDLFYVLFPLTIVPLLLFPLRFVRLDYRVIRVLPLRRWQQTALTLSFVLPLLLPVSAGLLIVNLFVPQPPTHVFVFLVAYGGCCAFAVLFGASILGSFGSPAGAMMGMLALVVVILDPSPPVVTVFGVYGILLWIASITYFHWESRGNGWLYTKGYDIEDMSKEGRGRYSP